MVEERIDETESTGIAGLLSATYHFMMGSIMDRLSAEGYRDLSKTQLHVLARFESNGMTLHQISQRVQISVHIVSNIVKMLITGGYVSEIEDSAKVSDNKYILEDRGKQVLAIVSSAQNEVEQEWKQYLGNEQMSSVISSLESLFNATIQAKHDTT